MTFDERQPNLYDIARMAAEMVAITEYGPTARIGAFQLNSVEVDHGLALTEEDGVHVLTPIEDVQIKATVRIVPDCQYVQISIKPALP